MRMPTTYSHLSDADKITFNEMAMKENVTSLMHHFSISRVSVYRILRYLNITPVRKYTPHATKHYSCIDWSESMQNEFKQAAIDHNPTDLMQMFSLSRRVVNSALQYFGISKYKDIDKYIESGKRLAAHLNNIPADMRTDMNKRISDTRKRIIRMERIRLSYGIPQKTNIRIVNL